MSYFENAKVGDKVCTFEYGNGQIHAIRNHPEHPIQILSNLGVIKGYCREGFAYHDRAVQTAFYGSKLPTFDIPPPPVPEPPMDTPVIVWNKGNTKLHRYVKGFNNDGFLETFSNGTTSFTDNGWTETWRDWELYKEDEL